MLLISLPIIAVMSATGLPVYWIAVCGTAIWLFGIIFEAIGDYQLRQFLQVKKRGEIMQSGLWKYTRHPNYFGEITAWWGAAIIALSYGQLWGLLGAATITILIVKISGIPLLEKRYEHDSAFQKYAKRTSVLLPLPPKRS